MPVLSIVILSHNRRDALLRTLSELSGRDKAGTASPDVSDISTEIIVVDNASTDGSVEGVRSRFPNVLIVALACNEAIQGFNIGAARARGAFLLILDDDAWPGRGVLREAIAYLHNRPDVGGVALMPTHPKSGACEWPFASRASESFPVMGSGNLVRSSAWREVGGYESKFFLYRNDVDLALKLLRAGWRVSFRPEWNVWHDSPHAASKSERWLRLATRNWVWLARRHESNWAVMAFAILLNLLSSLRAAGLDVDRLGCVVKGLMEGLREPAPPIPGSCNERNTLRRLLSLRLLG